MNKYKFIIYSPVFNEESGGIIALHNLCHLLNLYGNSASIYFKPDFFKSLKMAMGILLGFLNFNGEHFLEFEFLKKGLINSYRHAFYKTFESFNAPAYSGKILDNHIIVYPEIVNGNPLNGVNIVRWFLHIPGYFTGEVNYGNNELYFYFQKSFNNEKINPHKDNLLRLLHYRDDIFYKKNFEKRSGTCYAIRKGIGKPMQHDISNSILIDKMNLKQVSKVFNQCEYFYSYDTKTMYSFFAIMCGCKSIVIPDEGVSKDKWQPEETLRYGLAYGISDMEYAEKTINLFFENMNQVKSENKKMVITFVDKCYRYFNNIVAE